MVWGHGSVCLCGTDAQRSDWKCFTTLPGKSEVEMLYLHRGRCQELQFSTKQKSGECFGTRAYLVPGKPVACPHIMRGFFCGGLKPKEPLLWGLPKLLWALLRMWWGKAESRSQSPFTPELISYHPCGRCFWEDKICASRECGFSDYSPIFYGVRDGVCISNTAWWLSLLGEWCSC